MRFRARQRIRSSKDFTKIRTEGSRVTSGSFFLQGVIRTLENSGSAWEQSRLGVVASKRVGNAIVRARAKRLMREIYRKHAMKLAHPVDLVMVARPHLLKKAMIESENEFCQACRSLGVMRLGDDLEEKVALQ
ncbi:MAG: ribonuclease P protein component [Verrucomicrobiota bacterium]